SGDWSSDVCSSDLITEVPALEVDPDLEPGRANAIVVRIVRIEHEVERPPQEAESGDVDGFEPDVGLLEREPAERRAAAKQGGHGQHQTVERGNEQWPVTHQEAPLPPPRSATCASAPAT